MEFCLFILSSVLAILVYFTFFFCLKCEAKQATSASYFCAVVAQWLSSGYKAHASEIIWDCDWDRREQSSLATNRGRFPRVALNQDCCVSFVSNQKFSGSHRRISATAYPTYIFLLLHKKQFYFYSAGASICPRVAVRLCLPPRHSALFFFPLPELELWRKCKFFTSLLFRKLN